MNKSAKYKKNKKLITQPEPSGVSMHWSREGVESIVVAVILALLFRAFEAEAFVIPTGSMAPTLQGRHKDVKCEQCGHRYRAGSSIEQDGRHRVAEVTCPTCSNPTAIDPYNAQQASFSGDRILVNKFAYQFGDPQRWDVIVFKYPGNAKQNYIKRLVGLPGETIWIRHGDVFVRPDGESSFEIARKPPAKLEAMLQLVHDTDRIPEAMIKADWPQQWSDLSSSDNWTISDDRTDYSLKSTDSESWLRYRHLLPTRRDWQFLRNNKPPTDMAQRQGSLINDYYAYNDFLQMPILPAQADPQERRRAEQFFRARQAMNYGMNWVGDLALECEVNIQSATGSLALDLVEAGVHYTCHIDVANGKAELKLNGSASFSAVDGVAPATLTADTKIKGKGKHQVRFVNVDDQVLLWIGGKCVTWKANGKEHPGWVESDQERPVYSQEDLADLAPLGVGGIAIEMQVSSLRVLRDIYYIAAKSQLGTDKGNSTDYRTVPSAQQVAQVFNDPSSWSTTALFEQRNDEEFPLAAFPDDPAHDQFFPMGDNNPQSKDARLWTQQDYPSAYNDKLVEIGNYVERDLLIGKAFLVYWPHGWNIGNIRLPIIPNVQRMGRIR